VTSLVFYGIVSVVSFVGLIAMSASVAKGGNIKGLTANILVLLFVVIIGCIVVVILFVSILILPCEAVSMFDISLSVRHRHVRL
jgi:hypothetical protein